MTTTELSAFQAWNGTQRRELQLQRQLQPRSPREPRQAPQIVLSDQAARQFERTYIQGPRQRNQPGMTTADWIETDMEIQRRMGAMHSLERRGGRLRAGAAFISEGRAQGQAERQAQRHQVEKTAHLTSREDALS
jgi:hypothetical protein